MIGDWCGGSGAHSSSGGHVPLAEVGRVLPYPLIVLAVQCSAAVSIFVWMGRVMPTPWPG